MKDKILEMLSNNNIKFEDLNGFIKFVASNLKIAENSARTVIVAMLKRGEIIEKRKGVFVQTSNTNLIKGKIIGHNKGFAFFAPFDTTLPDFFVAPRKLNGALNGDTVLLKPLTFTAQSQEGEVVSIIKKNNSIIVGTVTIFNGRDAFIIPDNNKLSKDVLVRQKMLNGAKSGDRVVVSVSENKQQKLQGSVLEILGKTDDLLSLELGIIREHKLFEEFPENVLAQANKIPQTINKAKYPNRKDLCGKKIFTIDGADARDLDDAVSIYKKGDNYVLSVHIADVGEYVKYKTPLDDEAYSRGTSVYFPNMVLPMLPKQLSNGICSLNENVERLALSVEMEIDENGFVVDHKIYESVIKSCHRLTYSQVFDVMCQKQEAIDELKDIYDDIMLMSTLSEILENRRDKEGSLDLGIAESFVAVDENLKVSFVKKRERNAAHKLIENFMVICNETVSKHYCLAKIPFVYRVHGKPLLQKVNDAVKFIEGLGAHVPAYDEITSKSVSAILDSIKGKDYEEIASKVLLRSLQKAKYQDECVGHFGLALEYYSHFTSPIRRYPDLVIHRIIKDTLKGTLKKEKLFELEDFVMDASFQSSETEKNADEAERAVDDLFKASYMKDHLNEEFDAIISGVIAHGFFVQLENTVEGLVKIETLPDDNYLYMEKSLQLKGGKRTFRIGDPVKVKAIKSNLYERKIDFVIVP